MSSASSPLALPETSRQEPFFLHEPSDVWIVESGIVDLFLVHGDNGQASSGVRQHFVRIDTGRAFFGFDIKSVTAGFHIVASAAPGSKLRQTSQAEMRSLVSSGEGVGLLEQWIFDLSSAAVATITPKIYQSLNTGKEITIGKEAKPVLSNNGVIWVQHIEGSSHYLGNSEITLIKDTGFFPLSSPAWLEAEPFSRLHALSTEAFHEADVEWQSLAAFHRIILQCLISNLRHNEQKEHERREKRMEADSLLLDTTFQKLASPLSQETTVFAGDEELGSPLLLACQAIGRASGIQFRPHPDSRRGVPQKDPIANIAKASAVRVRRIILEGNWWTRDAGPLLTVRESDGHMLALLPSTPGRYELYDPVDRSRIAVNQNLAERVGPYAYVFYRPFPDKKLTALDLIAFGIGGSERDLAMILLMGIGAGLLGMLTPILTGILFDSVIPGAQRLQLLQISTFLIATAISTALFQLTRGISMLRLEGRMDASVQAAVWDRLLSLPVPFFRDFTAGDLAMRGLGINQMRQVLTGTTLSTILSSIFSVFSFFLLFYYSWRLALLATGLILVAFIVSTSCGYLQVRHQRRMSAARGRISGMVLQFINGISKFRVSGTEGRAFAAWASEFSQQKTLAMKARTISNNLAIFNGVFPILSSMAIFYTVAWLLKQPLVKPLTTGEFLAFNAAFGQFLSSVLQLSAAVVSVLSIVPLYERAKPILETLPEVDQAKADPGELAGDIEVSHLAFRYRPDAPLVLRDMSLTIKAGQFVAFVGSSGCGKSTLFRLLLGFEKPESGAVYYDGQDLSTLDVQSLRRQMGVVLQNGRLLSGDIFMNIVGSAPLTVDDAWEAAKMAGFDQDVKQMPMGMHTMISEGGGGLSGGQRQRLMIARAIVGKPRILLFDEATSALDNQTQGIVSKSLENLKATRIVIAHRLSTIQNADCIFVLDKGVVVQSGAYDELIQHEEGLFADLAKRQLT